MSKFDYFNFKKIHIGYVLKSLVHERNIEEDEILKYFKITKESLDEIYNTKNVKLYELLEWSKFLRFDLFRLFSMHLMLHHGISITKSMKADGNAGISIRKNVYTQEIKVYVVNQIRNEELSVPDAIRKYSIPKSTLYKWLKEVSYEEQLS
jgi:predicted transcriptional regulator